MKRIVFHNADSDGCARSILAGFWKYGFTKLIGSGYAPQTTIIEIDDEE